MQQLLRTATTVTTIAVSALIAAPLGAEPPSKTGTMVTDTRPAPALKPATKIKPGTVKADIPKPDLQVGVIQIVPPNPAEGDPVTFKGNVMNYGLGPATNPVAIVNITGPAGVTIPIKRQEFNLTLQKNQGVTLVHQFTVPAPGHYTCRFRIDPARMIAETNDTNNEKNHTFSVRARCTDLVVCISNGKRPPVGGSRAIHAVIKNIGTCSSNHAAQIRLRFYVEGKGVRFYDIPAVSPGHSQTITRNHSWSTSGTKTITAKVLYNWTDEGNTQNNQVSGSYFVRLPHHDRYSGAPKVKCSTGANFSSWDACNAQIP